MDETERSTSRSATRGTLVGGLGVVLGIALVALGLLGENARVVVVGGAIAAAGTRSIVRGRRGAGARG